MFMRNGELLVLALIGVTNDDGYDKTMDARWIVASSARFLI